MPHDNELNIHKGTGVGTDGSLHSAKEELFDHGSDRSSDKSDGVGTDGSLVNPEKELADPADVRDPDYTDRDVAADRATTERDAGVDPR